MLKKLESASSKSSYGKDKLLSEWKQSRERVARISNFSVPTKIQSRPPSMSGLNKKKLVASCSFIENITTATVVAEEEKTVKEYESMNLQRALSAPVLKAENKLPLRVKKPFKVQPPFK